jgi:hypothetical protein
MEQLSNTQTLNVYMLHKSICVTETWGTCLIVVIEIFVHFLESTHNLSRLQLFMNINAMEYWY